MVTTLIYHVKNYLASLNDDHLNSFLNHWPKPDSTLHSVAKTTLPVLTWLPDIVKATTLNTRPIAKLFVAVANYLAWGQTYSSEDFGLKFRNDTAGLS